MTKQTRSPAYVGVQHTWKHTCGCTSHSWNRLNRSMAASVALAIDSGQSFATGDFRDFYTDFRGDRWCDSETLYALAVDSGNISAAKSIEAWTERPAFIVDRPNQGKRRAAVGSQFDWRGEVVRVTSFVCTDGEHVMVACSYHDGENGRDYSKVKHRFRITRDDIIADRKLRKERKP